LEESEIVFNKLFGTKVVLTIKGTFRNKRGDRDIVLVVSDKIKTDTERHAKILLFILKNVIPADIYDLVKDWIKKDDGKYEIYQEIEDEVAREMGRTFW
jgi:hypothetical protein